MDSLYELVLDNMPYGIYILDNSGNYVYVNSTYVNSLGYSKREFRYMNVHDFVKKKEIETCISDIVYKEKRRVAAIQNVCIRDGLKCRKFQHLIISTPIFNASGEIQNLFAVCAPLDELNKLYDQAEKIGTVYTLQRKAKEDNEDNSIIAESKRMQELLETASVVAKTDTAVLITGESGTGKEVIAQYIHEQSKRANEKLVVINCASLPENLLEAELFGYESGAFTGAAVGGKKGLMEEAEGGTLFLDEINSMPLSLQGKLLRALETKTIQRVGATKPRKVDFRVLSASNENLEEAIKEKRFRLDLYYRLNVVPIQIPPVRERKEDILPLAIFFLNFFNRRYEKKKRFTDETVRKMLEYEWPGNVRELRNFVERAVVMTAGVYIEVPSIRNITASVMFEYGRGEQNEYDPKGLMLLNKSSNDGDREKLRTEWGELPLMEYLDKCEKEYVSYALDKYGSTYSAAEYLGVSQSAVMRKKKKYHL